jgi:orotate phosphoribosyltransferase
MIINYTEQRTTFLRCLKKHCYKEGDFTLASGAKSNYLIDCKDFLLTSVGHIYAANLMLGYIADLEDDGPDIHGVAGVVLGGCSLASAASIISGQWSGRQPFDALYIRKDPKDHGTTKLVEGQLLHGKNVVLLEDVLTTGSSAIKALQTLCGHGYKPVAVISIVDRLEGGRENIEKAFNIPVISLYTIKDFQGA